MKSIEFKATKSSGAIDYLVKLLGGDISTKGYVKDKVVVRPEISEGLIFLTFSPDKTVKVETTSSFEFELPQSVIVKELTSRGASQIQIL